MLTVACVLKTGVWKNMTKKVEYKPEHVARLAAQVKKHLTLPHEFVCLSDVPVSVPRVELIHNWPGWWSKMELYRPGLFPGRTLYLDLDTTVVGNINHFFDRDQFTVLMNLSSKKRDRIGSGILYWSGDQSYLYETFKGAPIRYMEEYSKDSHRWGDQGFLQEHLKNWVLWQDVFPNQVRSQKLDPPHVEDRIICAHGKPKPWDVPPVTLAPDP